MRWYTQIFTITLPLLTVLIPGAIGIWELSRVERRQLEWDQRVRKMVVYADILKSMEGFYENVENPQGKRGDYFKALRLCELHCPDDVIKAGNAFIKTVAVGAKTSQQEKRRALNLFRLGLRRDLQPETALSIKDFHNWTNMDQ